MASPLIILIANAAVLGSIATVMIVIAVSVDSWQEYTYDVSELARINNTDYVILQLSSHSVFYSATLVSHTSDNSSKMYYIYPKYSGLWNICNYLSDNERKMIEGSATIAANECFTFVTDYEEDSGDFKKNAMQIARLQNSAASCYIVVLIDLITAAVVGTIGIVQKQVASCMVTGVLYCMAALFSIFGLSMFHTKDYYEKYSCYSMDEIPAEICPARSVHILWAIPLAWLGVFFCSFASILWLVVARALRVIKAKTML